MRPAARLATSPLRRVAAPLPEAREGFDGDAADPVADGDDTDLGLRLLAEDRNEGGRVVEPSAGPHGVAIRLGEGLGIWASLGHAAFRDGGEALGEGNCRPLAFEFMFQSLDHDFGDAGLAALGQFLGEFVRAGISDVQDGAHVDPHDTSVKT